MNFSSESSIFKNEDILSIEYLPEMLPHRENQIKQLADNLLPASRGRKPQNIFFFGNSGTGKTAVTKFVFREFENEYASSIKTIYLNCWDFRTGVSILSEIAISLGKMVARRGWGKDEILSRLLESLKKLNKGLIICLDEVDQLVYNDQSALYDLLRINQYVDTPVGLVFISNNPHVFANLEPRIRSSLSVEEIEFKSYNMEEMKNILKERIKYGITSAEDGVVALIANHAVNKGGDVRVGLDCIMKAGRIAERANSDKLKVEHIKKILKDVIEVKPEIIKENLNEEERIAFNSFGDNKELCFSDLYSNYCKTSKNPVTKRRFLDYVKHLAELKMIELKKRKVNGKRIISKA